MFLSRPVGDIKTQFEQDFTALTVNQKVRCWWICGTLCYWTCFWAVWFDGYIDNKKLYQLSLIWVWKYPVRKKCVQITARLIIQNFVQGVSTLTNR